MRFWAIERGSYSDYSMGPFFTTKELAEAYIARHCPHGDKDCHCEYDLCEITVRDSLPQMVAHLWATVDVNGEITLYPETLREEPLHYSRRAAGVGLIELSGPKDRVLKVAGEISAERKAWAAGLTDPPPGWPPEPYRPPVPESSPPSPTLTAEWGRYQHPTDD